MKTRAGERAMAESCVVARREGARDGLNDKGLVGFDHKTRKPVYDFYKTEWNEGR